GTPQYLAPEQARDARKVDARSDIYSLGCSLYFLLTKRPPFQAEGLGEILLKHQTEDPTPLRQLRPDAPAALEQVVNRMLAKKPDDRPDSAGEVAELLEPFARGDAAGAHVRVAPPPPPPGDDTWANLTVGG